MDQQFSLRWNNYLNQITDAFGSLKKDEDLVDVTLSCEGKKLKAHKMLLSACSPYFREVFKENPCQHPVIVFRNFKYVDLEAIINFMYKGEVDVKQEHFESFLGTAELLEVKGLTEGSKSNNFDDDNSNASKVIDSGNELLSQDLNSANKGSSPGVPIQPHSKKRKSSTLPDKRKSSEKKQKASEPLSPIIPKIEDEELIEDLTFDEEDTDDSHSTSTDLMQVPLRRSRPRPDIHADYSSSSVPDIQDPSQLPKGHAHLPEAGSSGELLPPEMMQSQAIESTRTENTKNKKVAEEQKDYEQMGRDENNPDLKSFSSNPSRNIVLQNLDPINYNLVLEERPENQNEPSNVTNENLDDNIATTVANPSRSTALNFPKGLTVTVKEKNEMDFGTNQSMEEEEVLLRSEEAKTPVQEEPSSTQRQLPEICSNKPISSGQLVLDEPEMAEEAPQMVSDEFISEVQEEEKEELEPEFNYFGCDICKAESKPVDQSNLVLNHKCPICPCVCFCAHLLKEHMKSIHGWFNVKRRFNQY